MTIEVRRLSPEDYADTVADLETCEWLRAQCLAAIRRDPHNAKEFERLGTLSVWIARYSQTLAEHQASGQSPQADVTADGHTSFLPSADSSAASTPPVGAGRASGCPVVPLAGDEAA